MRLALQEGHSCFWCRVEAVLCIVTELVVQQMHCLPI